LASPLFYETEVNEPLPVALDKIEPGLTFENFQVTNGPDLRVYLTSDGNVKNGIHLENLKGSKCSQNYSLDDIDVGVYDVVVIYCQPFGVYFGQAELI